MKRSQYTASVVMWLFCCAAAFGQQSQYSTKITYGNTKAPQHYQTKSPQQYQAKRSSYQPNYQRTAAPRQIQRAPSQNINSRQYQNQRYQNQPQTSATRRVDYQQSPASDRYQQPRVAQAAQKTPPANTEAKLTFKAYPVPANQLLHLASQLKKQFISNPQIRIVADTRTSQLLVYAPDDAHATIRPALAKYNTARTTTKKKNRVVQRNIQLKNVTAVEFEKTLKTLSANLVNVTFGKQGQVANYSLHAAGRPGVKVSVDRTSNQVAIEGVDLMVNAWEQVISSLDVSKNKKTNSVKVLSLDKADKQDIRKALTVFRMNTGAEEKTITSPRFKGDMVTMLFQRPENQDEKEEDENKTEPKENQNSKDVGPASNSGLIGKVEVVYLEEFNQIILKGHPRDIERVAKIIAEIEALSETTKPVIVIHPLKKVGSLATAQMVTQLYNETLSARQGSVSITPMVKPNAILLIGRVDAVNSVIELINKLDTPVGPESEFEIFPLVNASAQAAVQLLREFYGDNATFTASIRQNMGAKLLVVPDYRTNSLVIQASPRDMREIRHLLSKLDTNKSKARNDMRVFVLKNSLAADLAPIIQQAILGPANLPQIQGITGQGAGQGGTSQQQRELQNRALMLRLLTIDRNGKRFIESGLLSDVRVTADARTNALIVTAPTESMGLIATLIEELDRQPSAEAQIKVFTIRSGDAQGLAETLQTLFGEAQGQAQNQLPTTTTAGAGDTSTLVPLRLAVDQRTNSVIVSGSSGDLVVVEGILKRLDDEDARQRETVVYRLKNSPAPDVATAINELIQSRRDLNQLLPGSVSPFEQIEQEVIVVSEPVSNSLIVSATPRYAKDIKALVDKLDERPPMVMIQVLIAEVRLNAEDEFGIELGLQDSILFNRSNGDTPGFAFNTPTLGNDTTAADPHIVGGQTLSNFALGRTNSALGFGGLVLQASSESVNVLIRALQQDRRIDILSRPQIMTLDNQFALVQVGARVPRITSSNIATNGSTINNTVLEDVGLILQVTPRISPDDQIVMEIDATKSELGPEAEGIPVSINQNGDVIRSPQINIITAQTVVSATNGQTVVLGGLITKTNSSTERQVPFLGNLPILGRLFRYDQYIDERTELLFIMTPHIVRNELDAARMLDIESSRMSWCMADVIDVHGSDVPGSLGLSEHGTRVIYPDSHPGAPETIKTPPANMQKPIINNSNNDKNMGYLRNGTDGKDRISQLRRRVPEKSATNSIRQTGYFDNESKKNETRLHRITRLPTVNKHN